MKVLSQVEWPSVIKEKVDLGVNLGPITKEEIKKATQKIKSGKAPGPNNIAPEALKSDLGTTADIICLSYIINLPNKDNHSDWHCQNWRGIQLRSLPSKVFTRVILDKIKVSVDAKLREEQAGFERSCPDQGPHL